MVGLFGCADDVALDGGGAAGGGGQASSGGGPTDGGGGAGGEGGGGNAPVEVALDWYTCPFVDGQQAAKCVNAAVPLDWDDPTSPKINVFVKRIPAAAQPARGQLWILQGGPGASGTTIEFTVPDFVAAADDLDIFIPDHRGTGFSSVLECPTVDAFPVSTRPVDPDDVAAEVPDCVADLQAEWGEGLRFFSGTGAGRDLGELIERTREPGQEVYVYGVSYGTRWAHRYLQQFPAQATGVIFDSIVGEPSRWLQFDVGIDAAAQGILAECANDSYCSGKLGPDPWQFMIDLGAKLDTGHCPTSLDLGPPDYKALFAAMVVLGWYDRALLPALAYRVDRCDATDQQVILGLRAGIEGELSPYFSGALHYNVVSGELIESDPPSMAELTATEDTLVVSSLQMHAYRAAYDLWPRYDAAPYSGVFADTDVPLLMLNGELDGQTTIEPATEFASHYQGQHQTFVSIPRGAHAVTGGTPLPNGTTCGLVLVGQFLQNPLSTIDSSCTSEVLSLDFEQVGVSFGPGTVDVWDNASPLFSTATPTKPNVMGRIVAERQKRVFR